MTFLSIRILFDEYRAVFAVNVTSPLANAVVRPELTSALAPLGAGASTIRLCRKLQCAILRADVAPWLLSLSASLLTQTSASVHHRCCPRGRLDGGLLEPQSGSSLEDAVPLLSTHQEKFGKQQSQLTLLVDTQFLSVQQVTEHSAPLPHLEDAGPSAMLPL